MEEDILYGKKRHLFGGLEPSNMKLFQCVLIDGEKVALRIELPTDTIIDGQVLCTVAGATIRRKTDGYPKDEFDGVEVFNVTSDGTYYDSDIDLDSTYFYAAFPYSDQGVYNRSVTNSRTSHNGDPNYYLYGYDIDLDEPDPYERVSYPNDVYNYGWTSAKMIYEDDEFDYGDWAFAPGEHFMPRPCMLRFDGTVDHYLQPSDYSLRADGDGSQLSSVADTSFEGNAMMEWPKIYTKRWEENGVYHFRCSNVKHDDTWDCWCNYDSNDNEIDHFYTSIYTCNLHDSKAKSISGAYSKYNTTGINWLKYTTNCGAGWAFGTYADYLLIQDLLVMMGHSTDTQAVYGVGYKMQTASELLSGTMDNKGLFYGGTSEDIGVKVFGMEHWWGHKPRFIVGLLTTESKYYVKITSGTHDGTTVKGFSTSAIDGYLAFDSSGITSGYVKEMYIERYGRIPKTSGGSASTYEADHCKSSTSTNGSVSMGTVSTRTTGNQTDMSDPYFGAFLIDYESSSDGSTYNTIGLSFKPESN